ncbi:MAG TPA: AMP-binding protein, partial [Thermoleophilia bacterium]|nr:AMP-binding protein [Thermoleophilia bacterium]
MSPTGPTSVTDLFRRQVVQTPDAVAVEAGSDRLTYAELDAWSDELARLLVDEHRVKRGDRVAVCLDRSPRLIAALLGVLKAGAAYVPIDVSEPERRMSDMIADAEPVVAVCEPGGVERFAAHALATTHVPPQPAIGASVTHVLPAVSPDDVAYLMYTSGSTGRPKAVVVEHRNITNLVTEPNYVELSAQDRILQLAPVAFDAATFEIWGALLHGGRLVVAPPGPVEPAELARLVREQGVTTLWLTAPL